MRARLLVLTVLTLAAAVPAAAHAAPLTFPTPTQADPAPWATYQNIEALSCPSATLCVGLGYGSGGGHALVSTNAAGQGAWTPTTIGTGSTIYTAISCPSANLCVALGGYNIAVSTNPAAGSWSVQQLLPDGTNGVLSSVSCPDVNFCVAVDTQGDELTSTNPAGGVATWQPMTIDPGRALRSVSCPSETLCVAGDNQGQVLVSQAPNVSWNTPTGLTGASIITGVDCTSASLCVVVDYHGKRYWSSDPTTSSSWSMAYQVETGNATEALTCVPATNACAITDATGRIYTATDATSTAWHSSQPNTRDKLGIACISTTLCVWGDIFGEGGYASDPYAMSPTWNTYIADGTNRPVATTCAGAALCVAADFGGNVLSTTNPTAATPTWTRQNVDGHQLLSIACATPTLCVAFDDQGRELHSTDGAGAVWSSPAPVFSAGSAPYGVSGVSCPAANLCVASANGNLAVSTSPATGMWGLPRTPNGFPTGAWFEGLSCPTSSYCVAVDTHGDEVTTNDPANGWSSAQTINSGYQFSGLSCPTPSLCIAALPNASGGLAVSSTPSIPTSWTLLPISGGLAQVSCVSDHLCITQNNAGQVLESTTPTVAGSWAATSVNGLQAWHLGCSAAGLCSAFSESGAAAIGVVSAPAVTAAAGSITSSGATLTGTVNPNAGPLSDCHFEYGTTSGYGQSAPCSPGPGAGTDPVSVSLQLTGLTAATSYHFRLVATNLGGTGATGDQSFTTAAASGSGGGSGGSGSGGHGGSGSGGNQQAAPVLSHLIPRPARFPVTAVKHPPRKPTTKPRKTGTQVTYSDSQAATTTFVVLRRVPGVRQGGKCVKPPKKHAKHAKGCSRMVQVGSFTHADTAGSNTFHFTGRVAGHALAPGGYILQASARNKAGKTSAAVTVKFTVVR